MCIRDRGMTTATIIMHQGINTGAVFGHVFDFTGMPIGVRAVSYTHLMIIALCYIMQIFIGFIN